MHVQRLRDDELGAAGAVELLSEMLQSAEVHGRQVLLAVMQVRQTMPCGRQRPVLRWHPYQALFSAALALSFAYCFKVAWDRRCATLPSIPRLTGRGPALLVMPACLHECAALPCPCLRAADGGPRGGRAAGGRAAAGACKGFTEVLQARGCTKPLRAPSASPQRASSGASSGGGGGGDKEEAVDTAQGEESSKEEAGAGGCGAKEESGAGVEAKEGYKAVAAAAQAVSCPPPPPFPHLHMRMLS